jgi:iron complex transport system substrate-binding protein
VGDLTRAGRWLARTPRLNRQRIPGRGAGALIAAFVVAPALAAISVVDDTGAVVSLETPARRIVALAPHATELVFAAGAGGALVGVVKGSDHPPAARALPVVGDATALDMERIVALDPDLVVAWPWTTPTQIASLRRRGVPVFHADPREVTGIADDIARVGRLAGTQTVAEPAAAALRERIARLLAAPAAGRPLRAFYQVSDTPLYTLGGHHLVTRAIEHCGGRNVFDALSIPAPQVGIEAVLAANPEVIIAGTDGAKRPAWLDRWTQWRELDAVRTQALFAVDANLLHRPGPRFVAGVVQLCDALAAARRAHR